MKYQVKPSLSFDQIQGLAEAISEARHNQFVTRENSLLNLTYDLCGIKVRTMTVSDYVLLERIGSPFVSRIEPTLYDLALFFWILSPNFPKWNKRRWLAWLRPLANFIHGKKVKRKFGKDMPATSEPVVVKAFEYIDVMFFDSPPSMANGQESCLSYLTGWFDMMQSEYHFSSEQVWDMGLPELFQRLNAIRQRNNPSVPQFNKGTDAVKLFVLRGLRSKEFTMDDLKDGKVKLPKFSSS